MKIKALMLFLGVGVLTAGSAMAQQEFSDGSVRYSIASEGNGSGGSKTPLPNSYLDLYFKNYYSKMVFKTGSYTYQTIRNARENTAVALISAGANHYMIRMNAEDLEQEASRYQGLTFTQTGKTRKVAGYPCKEAIGTMKDGSTFKVYYDPDLAPENRQYSNQFRGLDGLPLEFELITKNKQKLLMTATNVSLTPQPASLFDLPTQGYRVISKDELSEMMHQ